MKSTQIALFGLLLLIAGSCTKAPVANFEYSADELTAPVDITFTNTSTDADSYLWDFGDGNTSTEENPVHNFEVYGTISVSLTAKGRGGDDIVTRQIQIKAPTTYIVGNKTSITLYYVESYYWDEGEQEVTAWYEHGTMYSGEESPEIITEYSPLDLYFEFLDGTQCIVWDSYYMTPNTLNYMNVYDDTELYIYNPTVKSARVPGTKPSPDFLREIKEKGRKTTLGEIF